jgi:hypothetical protein
VHLSHHNELELHTVRGLVPASVAAEGVRKVPIMVCWRTEEACAGLVECIPRSPKATCLKGVSMARGRTTSLTLTLSPQERQTLLAWERSTTIIAGLAIRARIILLVAEGMPISHIADTVGTSRRLVYKWVKRFLHARVAGLSDLPGRGFRSRTALVGVSYLSHQR